MAQLALLVGEEILRIPRHGGHRRVNSLAVLLHDAIDLTGPRTETQGENPWNDAVGCYPLVN